MKNKKIVAAVLSTAAVAAGAAGLTACNVSKDTSEKDEQIAAVYELYVANAESNSQTPLSYEEWLNSIRGEKGEKGDTGAQGIQGEKGATGAQGIQGEKGDTGAQGEKGEKGDTGAAGADGKDGADGADGVDGVDGKSAYEIWLELGNEGTEADFINSLKGATGAQGEKGDTGATGATGAQGEKGETGATGAQGEKGETGAAGADGKDGADGADGVDGVDGKSAYEIWLELGNEGTEADFINSLKGATGAQGEKGDKGDTGATGAQGEKGDKGDTGATGAAGADGKDGVDGKDGNDGVGVSSIDCVYNAETGKYDFTIIYTDETQATISVEAPTPTVSYFEVYKTEQLSRIEKEWERLILSRPNYEADFAATYNEILIGIQNAKYFAKVDEQLALFDDLSEVNYVSDEQSLLAAAAQGGIVTLIKDIAVESVISIDSDLTLNLGEYTLTNNYENGRVFAVNGLSRLTVNATTGGMVIPESNSLSWGFFKLSNTSTLILNGGSYDGNTDNGAFIRSDNGEETETELIGATVELNNIIAETNYRFISSGDESYASITINGGEFTQNNDGLTAPGGTIPAFYLCFAYSTFNGVKITSDIGSCIEVCGLEATLKGDNEFTVKLQNSIQSWNCTAVAVDNYGTADIYGGSYVSENGFGAYIFSSNGVLNIYGGTFTGGKAALRVDKNSYPDDYPETPTINVCGGVFNGEITKGADTEVNITGGSFSKDVSSLLDAEAYKATLNAESGYYVVTEKTE